MIDTSFLKYPKNKWGYTKPDDVDMLAPFHYIADIVWPIYEDDSKGPKSVIEIGMFAGHSTVVMLELFKNLEYIRSYDPGQVSKDNAPRIQKRYPQFEFVNKPARTEEGEFPVPLPDREIDLVFMDGRHEGIWPKIDMITTLDYIKPRYLLADNMEHDAVRKRLKKRGLFQHKYNPKYFFYTNEHKEKLSPGIFGLFKLR